MLHFVNQNCLLHPAAVCRLETFKLRIQAAQGKQTWPRGRILRELQASGFQVAAGPGNVQFVVGLAFPPEIQNGTLTSI